MGFKSKKSFAQYQRTRKKTTTTSKRLEPDNDTMGHKRKTTKSTNTICDATQEEHMGPISSFPCMINKRLAIKESLSQENLELMAFDKKLIKTIRCYPILYECKPYDPATCVQIKFQKFQAWEEIAIVVDKTGKIFNTE